MAGPAKWVTITGIKLLPNPYAILEVVNSKMLKILCKFPEDYTYRQCTEKKIHERIEILKNNPDRAAAEEKLGVKYLEELVAQSQLELGLIKRMEVWKPWENLVDEAPQDQWKWPPPN